MPNINPHPTTNGPSANSCQELFFPVFAWQVCTHKTHLKGYSSAAPSSNRFFPPLFGNTHSVVPSSLSLTFSLITLLPFLSYSLNCDPHKGLGNAFQSSVPRDTCQIIELCQNIAL